jgi:aryl-alcohol dehydrogenase-like predicted oxidoreductase
MTLKKIELGNTGLKVSRLCYGTEPFTFKKGPPGMRTQGDKSSAEGGRILAEAVKLGVNFWDTSDDYGTHPHVAEGLQHVKRSEVVVADKSNAVTYEEGYNAVEASLSDLGTEYVDIMFLHIVPYKGGWRTNSQNEPYYSASLDERRGALKGFLEAKDSGMIKATALSTHSTHVLRKVANESKIDVVCTTLNKAHDYIDDGSLSEHIAAINAVKDSGKAVYVIKVLSAGALRNDAEVSILYALQFKGFIDAWNIGMYDLQDVRRNIAIFDTVLGV